MEENESMQGKDLAADLEIQSKIEDAIKNAILNNKKRVSLDDGKSIMVLGLTKEENEDTYKVLLGGKQLVIAKRDKKNDRINYQGYNPDLLKKLQNKFNSDNIRIIETQKEVEKRRIKRDIQKGNPSPKGKQAEALKLEIEEKRRNRASSRNGNG